MNYNNYNNQGIQIPLNGRDYTFADQLSTATNQNQNQGQNQALQQYPYLNQKVTSNLQHEPDLLKLTSQGSVWNDSLTSGNGMLPQNGNNQTLLSMSLGYQTNNNNNMQQLDRNSQHLINNHNDNNNINQTYNIYGNLQGNKDSLLNSIQMQQGINQKYYLNQSYQNQYRQFNNQNISSSQQSNEDNFIVNNMNTPKDNILLQIRFRDNQLNELEKELNQLQKKLSTDTDKKDLIKGKSTINTERPKTLEDAFRYMTDLIQSKDKELTEVEKNLEAVLSAIALDPEYPIQSNENKDLSKIAEKIVLQLETLMRENQELSKKLSFENSSKESIQVRLLLKENEELKNKIYELQQQKL